MQTPELFLDDGEAEGAPPRWREVFLHRSVMGSVVLALVLLVGLAAGLATLRQQTLDAERRALGALVAALADQADSALAASQTAMQATADELLSGAWSADDEVAQPLLRARAAALPWVRQLLLVDTEGTVVQSADDDTDHPAFVQADYFLAALGAAPGSAGLGTLERWPGQSAPWVPLSMPWYGPDGRQAGVVVLAADPSLLVGGFTRTRPAADAQLQLVRDDGRIWLTEPADRPDTNWPDRWLPSRDSASWSRDLREGDRNWMVVGHALQRAPMTMVLAREREALLRDWRAQAWLVSVAGLLALLVTAALSVRHAREQRWREQSQRRLQHQQERAARALQAAREGLWEWVPERKRHFLSPRMRELAGFGPNDDARATTPLGWEDRLANGELQRLADAVRMHLQQATPDFAVTLRIAPPGQPVRHVRVRGRAMGQERSGLPPLAGTAYDVSDEVAMAEQARKLDEQLQRARRLEALGTLAGGVAHDFNNVLAAIQGYGERAQDLAPEGSALRGHLQRMLDAARRGKTLVERITASGQGSGGQRRSYRPRDLLREAWQLATQNLPANVRAELDDGSDDTPIMGDPVAFFEACLNLLRNAVQAVHGGGHLRATLRVETLDEARIPWHGQLTPGRWLHLSVSDDGPGIAPDNLPHLLDPFFTTRAGQGGTGLGMTVVHNTVRDAGGALDVHTVPGQGTRFDLYVPWLPHPERIDGKQASDEPAPGHNTRNTPPGRGEVILVVDDEPSLVALLEETLADLGFEPRGFTRPAQAWDAFAADPTLFDGIVTDQLMPGLTGLELIARCKTLTPDLVSVIVTAYGGADFERTTIDAGVDAVLSKPVSMTQLGDVLAQAFARRAG